ncbi:maestro heat-like repeat-containing protein family member 1 isoform X3 [Anthonomus grandis grandis]|uniref:maestro heat-like repeat-containing protein family member 1 isoform X3 n=1 Tax=Anthonomus grandis grandis TaxID=2921223 RepID=UPI0021655C62|nr:maestro heat-like repeat-containing protein family member 1 isoform X3 [Anthonomus grandis grandis]
MSLVNGKTKFSAETQLQVSISVLLDSVGDPNEAVSRATMTSLLKLAEKYPNQLLVSCSISCWKVPNPAVEHNRKILILMSKICLEHIANIDGDTVLKLIEFCLKTMTEKAGYEPVLQLPAADVLVALGRLHYIQVADALLEHLQAGVVPHYTILHTLGSLASTNAYGIIPYLGNIWNMIVPLLGGFRTNYLKESFAFATQHFCEGLMEYQTNLDQVPDPSITSDTFTTELSMIYDVLISSWVYSREQKTVESVLDALTAMFPVLPLERVLQQIPKVIPVLLGLYKKHIDACTVTKCLHAVLTKGTAVNGMLLEPVLPMILNQLGELLSLHPDYAQPDSARGHSEVLRCYECIAVHFTDITIDRLLVHLRNNNDRDKLKGLIVITHLIAYSSEETIYRRIRDILKQVNELLLTSSMNVKQVLLKIITALAYKKVLTNKELNPDGPELYLEFILKMCCKQKLNPKNAPYSPQELQDTQQSADNALYVLTTSSETDLEDVLYQLLLKSFLNTLYDDAIVIILRCLTYLASKRERTERFEERFVRCMVLLSSPIPQCRGTFILKYLKHLAPGDLPLYKQVWDSKLPHLQKYLDQNFDGFNVLEWHELLFDFVNLLQQSNGGNESRGELVLTKAQEQLEFYAVRNMHLDKEELKIKEEEKRFLLKFIALVLCYIKSKETVLQVLDSLISNTRLTDYSELNACAESIGMASRVHLPLVLEKVHQIRKDALHKKPTKLFSFMKNHSHELTLERLRYVIINSYAEICTKAPSDQLLRVIENEILDFLLNELSLAKDFSIRKITLKGINRVAEAMHPDRNNLHIRMTNRDKVMSEILNQMHLHNGPDYIELFPLIIAAVTSLVRLPVPIESEDRIRVLTLFFDNVYNASAIYCKINAQVPEHYYGDLKLVPSVLKSFSELNQFVQEVLLQNPSPVSLYEVTSLLEPWIGKKKQEQRLPAIETLRTVLQAYLDNVQFAYDLPSTFRQTGVLLARVVPRCTDPNSVIRKVAVDCICLILSIAARYEGHMRDHDKTLSNSLQLVQQSIELEDPKLLFQLTSDLASVICSNLPQFQLVHLTDGLIDALVDCESSSSNGACVVLNIVLKQKGGELQKHATPVAERLLSQLSCIVCAKTRGTALRALLTLAGHSPRVVGGILLTQPLPYDRSFLICCDLTTMASNLLSFSSLCTDQDQLLFLKMTETVVGDVCRDMQHTLSWIVSFMGPFIRSDLIPQRTLVVAFFTYLIKDNVESKQAVLIENLLEMILDVQLDQSCLVRKIGVQGLGYAAENLSKELVVRYCNQILGILMNCLDYHNLGNESELILESLQSFSKLLNSLPGYKFHPFQVTAAVRIKLLFSQEDPRLRRSSIQLLGDLATSLGQETNLEAFKEQIQGNLITLLLHLCDPDVYVVKACKSTIQKVGPYLDCPEVNRMIQECLGDDTDLMFTDFIREIIKRMAEDMQDLFPIFVMTSVSYLKSQWTSIRANAALVTGLFYAELLPENKPKVSLETVCDKLNRLMQDDQSEEVRIKASQAISCLFL